MKYKITLGLLILLLISSCVLAQKPKIITHIKPLSMRVFKPTEEDISDRRFYQSREETIKMLIKFPEGYNPEFWDYDLSTDTHKGFSIAKMNQKGKYFPTTGFKGATFDIIGKGVNQNRYQCKLESGTWVTLSSSGSDEVGAGCRITFNTQNKPNTPATIKILDTKTNEIETYVINIPKKWAIMPNEMLQYNIDRDMMGAFFPALDYCKSVNTGDDTVKTTWQQGAGQNVEDSAWRQQYLYKMNELTNAPNANDPAEYPKYFSPGMYEGYFSRDIDTTFMGEWGSLYEYENSGWDVGDGYWTAESMNDIDDHGLSQFYIEGDGSASAGWDGGASPAYRLFTVPCRGE